MNNKNFIIWIIILFILSTLVKAEILCSYSGPDTSDDNIQLTDFAIEGPANAGEGDVLDVRFKLKNVGDNINLTDKGIFCWNHDKIL